MDSQSKEPVKADPKPPINKLENTLIRNLESWPEIFGISESEVIEIMDAVRQYEIGNQSFRDWGEMYSGIHRESPFEHVLRGWLACYRWMKSKQLPNQTEE